MQIKNLGRGNLSSIIYYRAGYYANRTYLGIVNGRLQQIFEVFEIRVVLIAGLLPLANGGSLPYNNIEESIENENHIVL